MKVFKSMVMPALLPYRQTAQEMVEQMEMGYIPFDQKDYDTLRDDIVSVCDIEGMVSFDTETLDLDEVHGQTVERALAWYFAAVQNAERKVG